MKNFYSTIELNKLSPKELLDLTSFGEDNNYFYSELVKTEWSSKDEYIFRFKDQSVVYTQDVETYEAGNKIHLRGYTSSSRDKDVAL